VSSHICHRRKWQRFIAFRISVARNMLETSTLLSLSILSLLRFIRTLLLGFGICMILQEGKDLIASRLYEDTILRFRNLAFAQGSRYS
jgi:hypothetical protein